MSGTSTQCDPESQRWLDRLRPKSPERDAAIAALHAHLLKAARYEIARRRTACPHLRGSDYDDLAHQAADDALIAVLRKLDDFRGDSRFTTWAYKFALLEAGVKLRRRAWQGRELPLTEAGVEAPAGTPCCPPAPPERRGKIRAVPRAHSPPPPTHPPA